jgi:hypothetical protein
VHGWSAQRGQRHRLRSAGRSVVAGGVDPRAALSLRGRRPAGRPHARRGLHHGELLAPRRGAPALSGLSVQGVRRRLRLVRARPRRPRLPRRGRPGPGAAPGGLALRGPLRHPDAGLLSRRREADAGARQGRRRRAVAARHHGAGARVRARVE